MSYFALVRREMQLSLPRLAVMTGLGGISTAAILAAVNSGGAATSVGARLAAAVFFVVALFVFIKTQNYIFITMTVEIEAIIHKLRLRLMDHVRRSELLALDAIGRSAIVAAITKESETLTQASRMLAFGIQGVFLIVFISIYVAYLSLLAFFLCVPIVGVAALVLTAKSRGMSEGEREALQREDQLFDRLTDILDGFKEVRLNSARSDDLFSHIKDVSRSAAEIKIRTRIEATKWMLYAQSSTYLMLGAVVFVAPSFSKTLGTSVSSAATAILFVVSTCWGLVQTIPVLRAANASAGQIEQLEARLKAVAVSDAKDVLDRSMSFDEMKMRNVIFHYVDKSSDTPFQIGPLDFELRSGEIVFITGGNGSGKSTFLKVLAGLYEPNSGGIWLDEMRVNDRTRDAYRALFAGIFFDYHLFRRLYGIPEPDPEEVDRLLRQFRLHAKTHLVDREFETLDLSSGQRKRLALIVSLLEKRPILLLDEWTAEQDPEFRQKFYDELLPSFHRAGVTLVVVTHDDRYISEFRLPARRLHMESGLFVEPPPLVS
ncbi:MAG: cyclic peptide export ABC transporter [Hyphomicrobiales bacterium]